MKGLRNQRDERAMRSMRSVRIVRTMMFPLTALILFFTACDHKTDEENDAASDVAERSALTALSAGDTTGFARAYAVREFRFPDDDGPHPEFRTEWWYWTGNLRTADGRRFGYQLTFFRQALAPGVRDSAWRSGQLYFANFALTDVDGRRFHAFERFNRGAAGLAGARAFPFAVWLDDWSVRAPISGEITGPVELRAAEGDASIALTLRAEKPRVSQGENGLSRKSAAPGNASYYYSLTRIASEGSLRIGGETYAVRGTSWLDREWSTSVLDANQAGWDWFAMTFDDGSELMLYQLRLKSGGIDPFSSGSFVDRNGKKRLLKRGDFRIIPRSEWTSSRSGIRWPSGWQLVVPALDLTLEVEPLLREQELPLVVTYWEGAARVTGTRSGYGYVELTGY